MAKDGETTSEADESDSGPSLDQEHDSESETEHESVRESDSGLSEPEFDHEPMEDVPLADRTTLRILFVIPQNVDIASASCRSDFMVPISSFEEREDNLAWVERLNDVMPGMKTACLVDSEYNNIWIYDWVREFALLAADACHTLTSLPQALMLALVAGIDLDCIDDFNVDDNPSLQVVTFDDFAAHLVDSEWRTSFQPFDVVILRTNDLTLSDSYAVLHLIYELK